MILNESGKLATVSDITYTKEDGTPVTITAEQRKKKAVSDYIETLSPAYAQAKHESPTQTFNRELSNVANAGVDHPVWKSTLEAAPQGASLNELTNPQKLERRAQGGEPLRSTPREEPALPEEPRRLVRRSSSSRHTAPPRPFRVRRCRKPSTSLGVPPSTSRRTKRTR
jgi:hypothetical protein